MSKRTNKLYNYLVNTFDLSKENVLEHIEARLDDILDKHLLGILQSNRIENMILNKIALFIKKGEINTWRTNNTFEDIIKEQVKSVVEEQH